VSVDANAQAKYDKVKFAWPKDPTGIELGFSALKLTAPGLEKLGQLYLDGGRWNGRQVVPTSWVQDSTRAQVATQGQGGMEAYGYQWWVTTVRGHEAFAAVGFGGQLVEVVPDLRLVVVITTEVTDLTLEPSLLHDLVADAIVPAVGG
jgi:CubicO group peptidase (beta-lactamase class C family)